MFNFRTVNAAVAAVLALSSSLVGALPRPANDEDKAWVTIWGTMPQLTEMANLPPPPFNQTGVVFDDSTIRQTVFVTLDADTIRLQISNAFGGSDLPITQVNIAYPSNNTAGISSVQPASLKTVTFSGTEDFIVPNGAIVFSDPLDFPVKSQSILTITIYLQDGQTTNSITSHPGSRTTTYMVNGNHAYDTDLVNATTVEHWYFISSIDAYISSDAAAVAVVGDSISDGRGSDENADDRWPDLLLGRLQNNSDTRNIAVVNEAAGGNRILADGLGPNALGRIDRDVIAQSGVMYAIIYEGVNDIGVADTTQEAQTAIGNRVIAAYDQMISRLHRFGIAVFGATITPMSGPGQPYSDPTREATRQRVNNWIRTSGRFDAVIDFDATVRNTSQPDQIKDAFNSGDYLHMNEQGYRAMADTIDLSLFNKYRNGVDKET